MYEIGIIFDKFLPLKIETLANVSMNKLKDFQLKVLQTPIDKE